MYRNNPLDRNPHHQSHHDDCLALASGNWAEEWRTRHQIRRSPDNPQKWNDRAQEYGLRGDDSSYVSSFIAGMKLEPGRSYTILDVGCGPGTLSLPLAAAGHTVYALDFSSGMLGELAQRDSSGFIAQGKIIPVCGAWEDDWNALGIPTVDIAIASRSTMVADLHAALTKLNAHTNESVCLTLAGLGSPKFDEVLACALGKERPGDADFVYCFNMLVQMMMRPEVSYIVSRREDRYATKAQAFEAARAMFPGLTTEEQAQLITFMRDHLVRVESDRETYWVKDYPHIVDWVFMRWETT